MNIFSVFLASDNGYMLVRNMAN